MKLSQVFESALLDCILKLSFQEKGYQATSEPETTSEASYLGCGEKRTGLLLSGPKSSFQMKVNFAFHLEIKVPESGGRLERYRIHVA